MDHAAIARAKAVLEALAALSPNNEQHAVGLSVPTEWFRWLPAKAVRLIGSWSMPYDAADPMNRAFITAGSSELRSVAIDRGYAERLAAVDQLRTGDGSLRAGWLFVAGTEKSGKGRRHVLHPLVTVRVRVRRGPGVNELIPVGDPELTPLIKDPAIRRELEGAIELGGGALDVVHDAAIPVPLLARLSRLQEFAKRSAAAAGFEVRSVTTAYAGPDQLDRTDGLSIVAGIAVYATAETHDYGQAGSLRSWAASVPGRQTAFHSLYVAQPDGHPELEVHPVLSPFVLTPRQADAVRSSRTAPITVISGAPGTGKSHTIAAVACDALSRGERVLVAARTDATVDALIELLERAPGPEPVVFGSNARRDALADRLSWGRMDAASDHVVDAARQQVDAARERAERLRSQIVSSLEAERSLNETDADDESRQVAPLLFSPSTDLEAVRRALATARYERQGWLARRRGRQALDRARRWAGAAPTTSLNELTRALSHAEAEAGAQHLESEGGLEIGRAWDELSAAEDEVRHALGRWLELESKSSRRLTRTALGAVAALATALRSGRAARREQLRRLEEFELTRALPLWIGTLADIDDLLPPIAAVFDLVILDEASSIDQPLAAPALLRGRRALVAGDPHQLRHVSFLSDDHTEEVLRRQGLDQDPVLAARLDVRRNSLFDAAAGVTPVLVLDEHFRSSPHLIDFVSRQIYGGDVYLATRTPRTQCADCIDVVRLKGERDDEGVVIEEVDKAIELVETLERSGVRSIGIVTPFRAQADALEAAALAHFDADVLEAGDVRIGTVHGFQGIERDVVVASLAVDEAGGEKAWRFVEDPHLFAVLATRARKRLIVLVSADPPAGGIVSRYLAQADVPPRPPASTGPVDEWTGAIAADLQAGGLDVVTAYPTGRHRIDVCLQDPRRSTGLECTVHIDGAAAHVERHLALRRAGWELIEAFASRWGSRRGELVANLLADLKRP